MRTIKKSFITRLTAQAIEADRQGLTSVAEILTEQITKRADAVRENESFYSYPKYAFAKDVENSLWDAAIRVADFYNLGRFDVKEVQEIIERTANDMIKELCIKASVSDIVSIYDEALPGEIKHETLIEVEE